MLPSDVNLQIGKIKNYNKKILVSSSSFNIGPDLKINLDGDKHIENDGLDIKFKKEDKRDVEMMKTEPVISKMTDDEEKAALILSVTAIFTVWWIFKWFTFLFLS